MQLNYSIKVVRVKTNQLIIEFCTKICYLLDVANLFKQVLVVTPSIRDKVVTKTVFIYIDCSSTILYYKKKKITQRLSIVSYLLFLVPSNVTISQSYYSIKNRDYHQWHPFLLDRKIVELSNNAVFRNRQKH